MTELELLREYLEREREELADITVNGNRKIPRRGQEIYYAELRERLGLLHRMIHEREAIEEARAVLLSRAAAGREGG